MSGLVIAYGISGCSIETPPTLAVQSLQELRRENVVVQQWDLSCGAAALATLLTYQHGDPTSEATIVSAMLRQTDPARVNERGGFSLLDLKRFADSRGYVGVGYAQLTSKDLGELAPIVVPITVRNYRHFVVFRGFTQGRALIADPAFGNMTMSEREFARAWHEPIGFTVELEGGIAPPGDLAADNAVVPTVDRALIWSAAR